MHMSGKCAAASRKITEGFNLRTLDKVIVNHNILVALCSNAINALIIFN